MNWQENILTRAEQIRELLAETRRIAVLGIKTEAQSSQPAFYVPSYLASAGFELIPVPVYYPEVTRILGQKVYRKLAEIPGEEAGKAKSAWNGAKHGHRSAAAIAEPPRADRINCN